MEVMTMHFTKKVDPVKKARKIRHRKMRELKIALCCGSIGFIFGITPYVRKLVELKRGYDAIGGEVFFPMLALVAYFTILTVIDAITEILDAKDEEKQCQ